jgi:hypothetical protein
MSEFRHATAPNLVVTAGGIQFGLRRFRKRSEPPLLRLNYFVANFDASDPEIAGGLASGCEAILLDDAGVG